MADDNPLDRISSGPAPQGPSPWRANRLPTGSPYSNGLYGTGDVQRRRRLGRAGWLALIAAVALLAGAVGWAAVTKEGAATTGPTAVAPTGTAAAPVPPSVDQIAANAVFTTALVTPASCALPPWSTERAAMQRFSEVALACLESVWALPTMRVELFSSPDGAVPGSDCPPDWKITSFGVCGARNDVLYVNADRMVSSIGNQAGGALQWLGLAAAGQAEVRSGVSADARALIRSAGGDTGPQGFDYAKREHMQGLCLAGTTVGRLVGRGVAAGDLARASEQAGTWSLVGSDNRPVSSATARGWFDRGSQSPTPEVCRAVWTVPVDEVS
ncbi:hypothetical protein [Tsukamurella strandjordii]|uniref:Metalloprotease n=1 Tax=Tsukamurella strandjordii TaxID=147577 RepID=A0AA90NDP5_9ACTN|nr:hypothetical protein [Tsukamurella strandjordii]MDP0400023.1 hypothetical protein [Tsukamurella strandjordii]